MQKTSKKKYPELKSQQPQQDLYVQDEMRVGLRTKTKKIWTVEGHRFVQPVQHSYQYFYVYIALNPMNGHLVVFFLPNVRRVTTEIFLEELRKEVDWEFPERREEKIIVLWDGSGAHRSKKLKIPERIEITFFPPYSPELNPVERFIQELRRELANQTFDTLEHLEEVLTQLLKKYWENPTLVSKVTLYPYMNPMAA